MHTITTAVNPYEQLCCCVWKTLFSMFGFYNLSTPSSAVILELWKEKYDTDRPFRAEHLAVFYSMHFDQL